VSEYDYACRWATQSLYQVPAEACTPVEVVERCVMTTWDGPPAPLGECKEPGYCEARGTRVFFEDIGGGTVRLYEIEDCELQVRPLIDTQGNPLELCDYSEGTPLPIVCECGCDSAGVGTTTSG
jgi:hypothetical protein